MSSWQGGQSAYDTSYNQNFETLVTQFSANEAQLFNELQPESWLLDEVLPDHHEAASEPIALAAPPGGIGRQDQHQSFAQEEWTQRGLAHAEADIRSREKIFMPPASFGMSQNLKYQIPPVDYGTPRIAYDPASISELLHLHQVSEEGRSEGISGPFSSHVFQTHYPDYLHNAARSIPSSSIINNQWPEEPPATPLPQIGSSYQGLVSYDYWERSAQAQRDQVSPFPIDSDYQPYQFSQDLITNLIPMGFSVAADGLQKINSLFEKLESYGEGPVENQDLAVPDTFTKPDSYSEHTTEGQFADTDYIMPETVRKPRSHVKPAEERELEPRGNLLSSLKGPTNTGKKRKEKSSKWEQQDVYFEDLKTDGTSKWKDTKARTGKPKSKVGVYEPLGPTATREVAPTIDGFARSHESEDRVSRYGTKRAKINASPADLNSGSIPRLDMPESENEKHIQLQEEAILQGALKSGSYTSFAALNEVGRGRLVRQSTESSSERPGRPYGPMPPNFLIGSSRRRVPTSFSSSSIQSVGNQIGEDVSPTHYLFEKARESGRIISGYDPTVLDNSTQWRQADVDDWGSELPVSEIPTYNTPIAPRWQVTGSVPETPQPYKRKPKTPKPTSLHNQDNTSVGSKKPGSASKATIPRNTRRRKVKPDSDEDYEGPISKGERKTETPPPPESQLPIRRSFATNYSNIPPFDGLGDAEDNSGQSEASFEGRTPGQPPDIDHIPRQFWAELGLPSCEPNFVSPFKVSAEEWERKQRMDLLTEDIEVASTGDTGGGGGTTSASASEGDADDMDGVEAREYGKAKGKEKEDVGETKRAPDWGDHVGEHGRLK
ncbi:MAG: hypothetical protein MMC33_009917 [Icmadophila ericetorum]|nr:hypothetical protein [Icmadophila ericetorum]